MPIYVARVTPKDCHARMEHSVESKDGELRTTPTGAAESVAPGVARPNACLLEEARFRLLVESVRDYAIFMLDPSGRVITWNSGAERLKGWRADEIIGRSLSTFYPPEDVADGKPDLEIEVATREGRFEDEGWRVRKDGTRFWANVVLTAIRDESGRLCGFAKVTRDFSERRAAEETARRLAAETAALRAAQDAIELRDEFLSIAGHELKTPLTAILFHAESLAKNAAQLPPRDVAQRSERVMRNAIRLARLVDQLLDVSRITAGRLTLSPESVDLAAVAREVVARSSEAAARAGTPLRLEAAVPVVGTWDPTRVEQVVENLVTNAVKYGGGQPVDVAVAREGSVARLVVRDRGMGIADEDQARIFERFERAVSSRHFGGLGLGLWIVRQIVEAHGGCIGVVSRAGHGAEFTVELPLADPGGNR